MRLQYNLRIKIMSITPYRENLALETQFFYSNNLPISKINKHKVLHKLISFQLPIGPQVKRDNSFQKQEKERLHNSQGKLTRGALQKLRNEAVAFRKKIALKSTTNLLALVPHRSNPNNEEECSPISQKIESPCQMLVPPEMTPSEKSMSSTGTNSTISSLEKSKHDSVASTVDRTIIHKRQFKVLSFDQKREVFQILRYLDSGSFGEVYLVRHLATGMLLCLKSIRKDQFREENLPQLARQIKIQSSLSHPNIIKVYGCSSDERNFYILMEPCLGKNLFKLMNAGTINEAEARNYLSQVCQAVAYLHGQNIIHRDIKPQNILIDCGTAKLCDFGWAVYSPLLRETRCGTPLYTPPEMMRMQRYDSRVDVWCIGLMTYEMLYGKLPFEISHPDELSRIVTDTISYPPNPKVSEEAQEFMRGCLSKQSHSRLTIKQALEHEFLQKKKLQFRHTFP